MPRVSRAEADRHRAAIEEATARLIRERGLSVSVADVMSAVGLTHGGFYGHFDSKDALAAIAMARAFEEASARWQRRVDQAPDARRARAALFAGYLHPGNRNVPATGCPLAALATDVARTPPDKPVRAAYRLGLESLLAILQSAQPEAGGDAAAARRAALLQMSTLVGVMVLARATSDDALSDELLAAVRARLLPDDVTAGSLESRAEGRPDLDAGPDSGSDSRIGSRPASGPHAGPDAGR